MRRLVRRLSRIGVDESLARHQTRHIVITNQLTITTVFLYAMVSTNPKLSVFGPLMRPLTLAGVFFHMPVFFLNHARRHFLASSWLIVWNVVFLFTIGLMPPLSNGHILYFIPHAMGAWFVFPPSRFRARVAGILLSFAAFVGLGYVQERFPPSTGDVPWLAFANRVTVFITVIAYCIYFTRETTLAEESLARELQHQVGDRARRLAEALTRLQTAPSRSPELAAGDLVSDRYRILRPLGAGGMGAVYEVERTADGRRLALKVLRGAVDREALARFAREAQIAADLQHPNVVATQDVDVTNGGMLFLVMELMGGTTLEAARARFGDAGWATPILRQIAAALAALHQRGIVHRDLKPANVLLDGDRVKVADFGIASLTVGSDETLTRTGVFMGTPRYMAPEVQRSARAATPASDLFSLGILAKELLAGPLPIFERCLADQPEVRPTAAEVLAALS